MVIISDVKLSEPLIDHNAIIPTHCIKLSLNRCISLKKKYTVPDTKLILNKLSDLVIGNIVL